MTPPPGCDLVPVLLLAIDLAPSPFDLRLWWYYHRAEVLGLDPEDRAMVVAAKDRKKVALGG